MDGIFISKTAAILTTVKNKKKRVPTESNSFMPVNQSATAIQIKTGQKSYFYRSLCGDHWNLLLAILRIKFMALSKQSNYLLNMLPLKLSMCITPVVKNH